VDPLVEEHVGERAADLEWSRERARVVAVGDELAVALEELVEALAEARAEASHAALEAVGCVALDDEVDVIGEHVELDDVEAEASAGGAEDREDEGVRLGAAQAGQAIDDADRDVQRVLAMNRSATLRGGRVFAARRACARRPCACHPMCGGEDRSGSDACVASWRAAD
jgi:hypothetical protein